MADPVSASSAFAEVGEMFSRIASDEAALAKHEAWRVQEEARDAAEKEAAAKALLEQRIKDIPSRYRQEFNPKLSGLPPEVVNYCRTWTPESGEGIGLTGTTGIGKTRILCRVLMRLKCSWLYLPAGRLSQCVSEQWNDTFSVAGKAEATLRAARKVRVLFLDDIGDEKNTESVTAELKELVERRVSREMPILWTSNLSEAQMKQKHGERGAAIVRRLAEFTWTP